MTHHIQLKLCGSLYKNGEVYTQYIPLTPAQSRLIFRECYARLELISPISGGIVKSYSLWNKKHEDEYMFTLLSEVTIF